MEDLLKSLEHELALADARKKSSLLTRPVEQEKREAILDQNAKDRKTQIVLFKRDRSKRLWMAARKIAADHGEDFDRLTKRKDAPSRARARRVGNLSRKAVTEDHDRRIGQIDNRTTKALLDLVQTARDREAGPQPSAPPKRLTDQRDAPDRLPFNRSR